MKAPPILVAKIEAEATKKAGVDTTNTKVGIS